MTNTDPWDPRLYDSRHSFVNQLAQDLVEELAPKAGERILDLGCGTGALAQQIADSGAEVLGIDASPAMIARARQNYPKLRFEVGDALTMQFDEPFDAIFSNAVLHWVKPPETAAQRMFDALKPGGRLVMEMGGKGNVAALLTAAIAAGRSIGMDLKSVVDINYFPSVGDYTHLLEEAGFVVNFASIFDRPTKLNDGEAGLTEWFRMFRPALEKAVPQNQRAAFFREVGDRCRARLFYDGNWHADYRRLRLSAGKPKDLP